MKDMKMARTFPLLCLALAGSVAFAACSVASAAEMNGDGGASSADSAPPAGGGDDPIKWDPSGEPPVDLPLPGGAQPVEPEPGIVDAIAHAWDHIDVASDGRTLTVYYWGGVQDCYGLDRVDVTRAADGSLAVSVFEGRRGHLAPDTACIDIALLKAVTVVLEEPIVAPSA